MVGVGEHLLWRRTWKGRTAPGQPSGEHVCSAAGGVLESPGVKVRTLRRSGEPPTLTPKRGPQKSLLPALETIGALRSTSSARWLVKATGPSSEGLASGPRRGQGEHWGDPSSHTVLGAQPALPPWPPWGGPEEVGALVLSFPSSRMLRPLLKEMGHSQQRALP